MGKKALGTMRIGAVARQPKMAEDASLFRPTLVAEAMFVGCLFGTKVRRVLIQNWINCNEMSSF